MSPPAGKPAQDASPVPPVSRQRYVIRPDGPGFRVVDIWTGAPAMVAATPQAGLSEVDAAHVAGLLNGRD